MRFIIEKPKIFKGLCYVLKSSLLKEALEETNLDLNISLNFWTPQKLGSILSVEYWFPNENVEYDRFYIRAGAIKSENRKRAEELMNKYVIPDLIIRIKKIKNESINSTKFKQGLFFEATFEDEILKINGKEIKTNPNQK